MVTTSSLLIRRENEAVWDILKARCEEKGLPINAVLNSILPNLSEAIESYNPRTRVANMNLGPIIIK